MGTALAAKSSRNAPERGNARPARPVERHRKHHNAKPDTPANLGRHRSQRTDRTPTHCGPVPLTPVFCGAYSPPASRDASKTLGYSMSYLSSKVLFGTALLVLSSTAWEGVAHAQMTPGGPMGGGGGMGSQPAGEEKKDGVA